MKSLEKNNLIWAFITCLTSLYVSTCILIGAINYRSFGLWFKLEVGVAVTLLAFLVIFICDFKIEVLKDEKATTSTSELVARIRTLKSIYYSMYSFS
jgi:hypothetical protein